MNWQHFQEFLRELGVEMEDSGTQVAPTLSSEPTFTLLQRSRDHEAFYRVDLIDTKPELMVLIPTHDNPLRFHFYLVQQSSTNPLFESLDRWVANQQKSETLGQIHEVIEWHTLQAMIDTNSRLGRQVNVAQRRKESHLKAAMSNAKWYETMKALFWVGLETGQFPHEIVVYKLL